MQLQAQFPAPRRPNLAILSRLRTPSGPRDMRQKPSTPQPNFLTPMHARQARGLQRMGHSYPERCLTPYIDDDLSSESEETLYSSCPENDKTVGRGKPVRKIRKSKPVELPPPSAETERLWQANVPFAKWAEYLRQSKPVPRLGTPSA
ncbi:hypothetical protein VNI00_014542 [Paramarasmius palmivorus]|uniref:Uncharacterized protein n=1 Tax=Paramarasmius palmivorus TaxID=297713 RepID=A0AAW0BT80_9AGAR